MRSPISLNLPDGIARLQPIVLFDGECTLCSRSVKFLLRHNHSGNMRFASLQSATGLKIAVLAGKPFQQADTLLLLQNNVLTGYSTATLEITAHLGFPWHLLRFFIFVPEIIRETLYRFVAKNRYRWFGRESFCLADQDEYLDRFIS